MTAGVQSWQVNGIVDNRELKDHQVWHHAGQPNGAGQTCGHGRPASTDDRHVEHGRAREASSQSTGKDDSVTECGAESQGCPGSYDQWLSGLPFRVKEVTGEGYE